MNWNLLEGPPHSDGCECLDCDAYWTAYSQAEDDERDKRINWRDYV